MLGIDEHFFTRRHGYATTFCDLRSHKVFDVVLGRSEAALESYLDKLPGKERVRVVCIDLASAYRTLVRKHFPNARIVADRFRMIRLVNQHFLACWREIDPVGSKRRGLVSLMGSDFDGGPNPPRGIHDISDLRLLTESSWAATCYGFSNTSRGLAWLFGPELTWGDTTRSEPDVAGQFLKADDNFVARH